MERILSMVEGWGRKIEGHFDKPKKLEVTINLYRKDRAGEIHRRIPAPCPSCGESYAHHPVTGDKTFALILEYREVGKDTMGTAIATCRFCGETWKAGSGVRELAYAVERAEEAANKTEDGQEIN
jgi:ribosomal protein L37AE/L43A